MNQTNQSLKRDLERQTKQYHKKLEQLQSLDRLLQTLEWYVDNLLPLEMEQIRSRSPAPPNNCYTLVLLVGYSLEPLLQSICFYQPRRIILALNESYGRDAGYVMGEYIESLVRRIEETRANQSPKPLLEYRPEIGPKNGDIFRSIKADPALVFQLLLETLQTEPAERVVIDVTGAKKNMVTGAFLYAAFANISISYVEFADEGYDLSLGRPEGHRSVIQQLTNPYGVFALREWERLRHLYNRYNFRAARELLAEQILPAMRQTLSGSAGPLFAGEQIGTVRTLEKLLKFYDRWERGDFRLAAALQTILPDDKRPSAIQKLAELLPENVDRKNGERAAAQLVSHLGKQMRLDKNGRSFLLKPELLGVYAADETARIGRLIAYHKDYRSALMRAAGLYELLLHARILALWHLGEFSRQMPGGEEIYKTLVEDMRGLNLFEDFTRGKRPYPVSETVIRWPADEKWRIPESARLPPEIKNLRDKTTHQAVPVPEATACLAFDVITANLENYCAVWAPQLETNLEIPPLDSPAYQAQPWSDICRWCGLDSLLTPNLLEDEGAKK